jgi:hypothetical protein
MTTLSPLLANAVAIASPMPLVDPVTTTVLAMLFSDAQCAVHEDMRLCAKRLRWQLRSGQISFVESNMERFPRSPGCPIDSMQ